MRAGQGRDAIEFHAQVVPLVDAALRLERGDFQPENGWVATLIDIADSKISVVDRAVESIAKSDNPYRDGILHRLNAVRQELANRQ
jgi:hypothetical protein